MANAANHYRRLAQECERIAHTHPPGSRSRTSLLEMARMWERLSQEATVPGTMPRPTEAQRAPSPAAKRGGIIWRPQWQHSPRATDPNQVCARILPLFRSGASDRVRLFLRVG